MSKSTKSEASPRNRRTLGLRSKEVKRSKLHATELFFLFSIVGKEYPVLNLRSISYNLMSATNQLLNEDASGLDHTLQMFRCGIEIVIEVWFGQAVSGEKKKPFDPNFHSPEVANSMANERPVSLWSFCLRVIIGEVRKERIWSCFFLR